MFNRLGQSVAAAMLVVGATLAGGCGTTSAPRLEHAAATVSGRTADGVAMLFTLDAFNDNDIALPLRDIRYTLSLNGRDVFRGTRSAEATLRRNGVQQLRLPAVVSLGPSDAAPTGVMDFRLRGTMTYVTPGKIAELLFDTGVRVPSAGFETTGQIDLGDAGTR